MKRKNQLNGKMYIAVSAALTFCCTSAFGVTKANNATVLNLGGSWTGSVVPSASDVALWDSTVSATNAAGSPTLASIGGSLSVSGIQITNVGGTANQTGTNSGIQIKDALSANTWTIGAGGIDMSTATQAMLLQSKVTLAANQTWNVANANTIANPFAGNGINNGGIGEDLLWLALLDGAAFNLNGKTLTVNGAGSFAIAHGYAISNGTMNLNVPVTWLQSGGNRTLSIANTATINVGSSSLLRLRSNSGLSGVGLNSAAPINLGSLATLQMENNNASFSNTQSGKITMGAGSILQNILTAGGAMTMSGEIAASGDFTWNVSGGASNAAGVVVSGNLTGSGNITYANTNSTANGQVRLSGNNSGYAGIFTINGASGTRVLRMSSATAGSSAATWSVATGNTLQVDGVAVDLGTLNGAGTVTNSHVSNAATLTVGSGNFSGLITPGATAGMSLTKNTSGTLLLSGANTYAGATLVNAGKLSVSSLQSGSSAVTVADGAHFEVDVATANDDLPATDLTLGSTTGSTLTIHNAANPNPSVAPITTTNLNLNGVTTLNVVGSGFTVSATPIPLIAYTNKTGSGTFNLNLPARTNGTLNDTGTAIELTITSTESAKWNGNVDQNWDIDPDGTGSTGTLNWVTSGTNTPTRYLQGTGGTDAALFDDSASGTGALNVNLTTTLTPTNVTVNNPTRDYTFSSTGKLSGSMTLLKEGAGTLNIINTTANDYTGITTITEGAIVLGDGATAGAGVIASAIVNDGMLVLNRPDDFTLSNTITGSGAITKQQSNTLTINSPFVWGGTLNANAGKIIFSGGGTLSGEITGSALLENTAGTLYINGVAAANSCNGNMTISGGSVHLGKSTGPALGGDIYYTSSANGALVLEGSEQIADTSNIFINSPTTDPLAGTSALYTETWNNLTLNTTNGITGQFITKGISNILGTAYVNSGILSCGSNSTTSIAAVNITGGANTILRVSANTAPTTLSVGSGGITTSGGAIEVKINSNNQDAILNLGGNFTATGNVNITNAGYTGANANVINLTGSRTFDIAAGTTTTVAPDLGDVGDLIKVGDGTLVLGTLCNAAHAGATTVNAGILIVDGTMPNSAPALAVGTTLGGSGTITAATSIPSGVTVSPGNASASTLHFGNDLTLASGSTLDISLTSAGTDAVTASGNLTIDGTIKVTLSGYTPVANDIFTIATAAAYAGTATFDFTNATLGTGLAWDTSTFTTDGKIRVKQLGYEAFASVITNPADRDPLDDPDGDCITNLLEYVLAGDPTASAQSILPVLDNTSSTVMKLTFSREDNSEVDTIQIVQFSSDLTTWTDIPITPSGTLPSGVSVNVIENGAAPDTIEVEIPKNSNTKLFGRVQVTKP